MSILRTIALLAFGALLVAGCGKSTKQSAVEQGRELLLAGEWDQAIERLTVAVETDPLDSEARVLRGRAYMCRGRENAPLAIADYNEAIHLAPENYEAYYNRGIAYRQKGDHRRALADETHARRIDPSAIRAGAMQPESFDDFRKATGRPGSTNTAGSSKKSDKPQEDPTAPAIENMPIPRTRSSEKTATEPGKNALQSSSASSATSTLPLRDAYGMPIGAPSGRAGSITEEILGLTERSDPPRRSGGGRAGSNRAARPNWQTGAMPEAAAVPAAPSRNVPKESPIGKLPAWGLPFQQPGYSPYSPNRPSTGLRNNPLQTELPGYGPRYTPYNQPLVPPSQLRDDRF